MLAFVNIIPSPRKGEATIDLMRQRAVVPNGIMDHLFVRLFQDEREKGFTRFNLGLAPMSGFEPDLAEILGAAFRDQGFLPMAGAAGGRPGEMPFDGPLKPGDAVGVTFITSRTGKPASMRPGSEFEVSGTATRSAPGTNSLASASSRVFNLGQSSQQP